MPDNVNVIRNGFFAPDFSLSSTDGKVVSLKDFISDNFLALCFFSNRDSKRTRTFLSELNGDLPRTLYDFEVRIAAISPDKINRLTDLKNDLGLQYPLLSDPHMEICGLYSVVDTGSLEPAVHFSIFVVDNEFIIRHRFIESLGNVFRIENFKKDISAII
jgi:peroxiredoxin